MFTGVKQTVLSSAWRHNKLVADKATSLTQTELVILQ